MTQPILEVVTPRRGHTGGRTLVQVEGQHFRVPVSVGGPAPSSPPAPTVRVLFDGIPARAVQVVSESLLRCSTPRHPPTRRVDGDQITTGLVDVVVENLDDDGVAIPGESTTLADAYTFERPSLAPERGAWANVIQAFQRQLQELLLENVAVNPSTDYDADTGEPTGFVQLADTPGIAIVDIVFPPTDEDPKMAEEEVPIDGDFVLIRRAPLVVDITMTLVCVSENLTELLNLIECTTHVFRDFGLLVSDRDPAAPAHGQLEHRMILVAPGFSVSGRLGLGNMMTAQANVILRNIESSDMPGAPLDGLPQSPKWMGHQGTVGLTTRAKAIAVGARQRRS